MEEGKNRYCLARTSETHRLLKFEALQPKHRLKFDAGAAAPFFLGFTGRQVVLGAGAGL